MSGKGQGTAARTDNFEHALVLETARVTEGAALAASRWVGMGDKNAVDGAGTEAMRELLNSLDIRGTVVIGEGEMDEAPMLYIGEQLGQGRYEVDIAVDPVEGTNVTAKGLPNGLAVIALSERGGLMHAPDCYMEKLVVPPPAAGRVHLEWPVEANLAALAQSLDRGVEDLLVTILDRERHEGLIRRVRAAGARVKLIGDGDVVASLAVGVRGTGVHALMGSGGAPEGVLSAAAMKCLGAEIQGRFIAEDDAMRERFQAMGVDENRVYKTDELASGSQIVFSATGITYGELLNGVRRFGGGARTHTLVMGYASRVVRFIDTVHLEKEGARVTIRV
ncbi:class II fructose-bisphosphatase [Deinococcus metallilatus]|uniref:Fructose-1,6-bisphosphatase n=1 Tax=Deinococcus metallilatus TaxID=1211322 RepID=A0AAJ5F0Q4_9DEIO|nr:class II fructose-bisphosphatase [Deinococcus metallilatus]MBB5297227.1 fructose-1,6-bisphosphatase II [Deinococcus metallilatus]QBY09646.1 class II fructose-bisphosphatase [Deinococcus metallilatus]RXJ09018.1 class II fructose-bisphosphatase [Deinococcus metallilatus]TLK21273.1 class II fructose-bisphosphatase [Deinococcus metallilatus]GMA17170.1 fructose-1,6-bisphosphatase [Deinococcus metallilatus]